MPSYQHAIGLFSNAVILIPVVGAIVLILAFCFIRSALDLLKLALLMGVFAGIVFGFKQLSSVVGAWQKSTLKPVKHHTAPGLLPSVDTGMNVNNLNPTAHLNPEIIALAILIIVVWTIGYLFIRTAQPTTRARLRKQLQAFFTFGGTKKKERDSRSEYELPEVELAISKDSGKPITIAGKDRFIGTLVVGAPGTGKTSRILAKGAFQDLANIAHGVPMDLFVMDPDGGLVDDTLRMADSLGIPEEQRCVIDLREKDGHPNTVSFSPFHDGKIHTIVDNVRAVLREQMGDQEAFFQIAQDDLIRTVIQVQLPLWPDTDFVQFADLATDPIHFRAVCLMLYNHVNPEAMTSKKNNKKNDDDEGGIPSEFEREIAYVRARYDELESHVQSSVLSAARSFLQDTRTEQKLENLEKVTKGLKLVLNELSTNSVLKEVLGKSKLPTLNFGEFLSAGKEEPGRIIAIVTTNSDIGDLFGKLILVSFKMYLLTRSGNENTRRPIYRWIDEFHRYATENIKDEFVQARKYRSGTTIAIQERSQLELKTYRDFLRVAEVGSRNKIYFPSLSAADAQFLEKSLGSIIKIQESNTENRLGLFLVDGRRSDRKVMTREMQEARFKLEDLQFGLTKNEAIFVRTVDNQAQIPEIGVTSYASEWVKQNKKLFTVKKEPESKKPSTMIDIKEAKEKLLRIKSKLKLPEYKPRNDNAKTGKKSVSTIAPNNLSPITNVVPLPKSKLEKVGNKAGKYVREEADPNDVVPVPALLKHDPEKLDDVDKKDTPIDKTELTDTELIIAAPVTESRATMPDIEPKRSSLRKKPLVPTSSENVEEKTCPNCGSGKLHLTEDKKKWRCSAPSCTFERKNRSAQ